MLQVRSEGEILDLSPNQEISLTFDNPFFESDRIPIAVSTPIEFMITPQTCRIFQFVPAMLIAPGVRKKSAELLMNGLVICSGALIFDEYADNRLSYTFVGADFEDVASGNLSDIKFNLYEDTSFSTLVSNARSGACRDFALPQIMRQDFSGESEYRKSTDTYPECSGTDKYANWLGSVSPYVVPAIPVARILESVLPDLSIYGYDLNRLLDKLAILGINKSKENDSRFGVIPTYYVGSRPYPYTPPTRCTLDLADSMPDMSVADFISNLLKMTCSTLFCQGRNYTIWPNENILTSTSYIDWDNRVSSTYSCSTEEGQKYSLSFQSSDSEYTESNPDDPDQLADTPSVLEASNMMDVISKIKTADGIVSVKHVPSGDIISGWKESVYLYHSLRGTWNSLKTTVALTDIAYQSGFSPKEISSDEETTQEYDCSVSFHVPKCVPTEIYYTTSTNADGSINQLVGLCSMTPVIDLPGIGGSRSDEVYIGLLLDNNFVDKGVYFTRPVYGIDPGSEMSSTLSLAIEGDNGLFEMFHKTFADWIAKTKSPRRVDLNLSPSDIAGLSLWKKYLMWNQTWLIKSLEITLSTSTDYISATADIVPV